MSSTLERLTAALSNRYRLEREIGAGGMATVYLAQDLKHDREVAIKVLHPDLGAALGGERFLAEIKTTAKLQHPHILPLLDSGEADGLLFYVMPLVEGETLRSRLERERQLPIDAAVRIATEVAGALDYAHRHGVIHRDIKPENILLHDGRAVVADFGIALAVTAASGNRMTQTGLSLGTPQYMSPEQAMGEKVIDARSDIYALGAVLYEMLTGEPPFSGATVQAIVAKVLTEKPMHPTAVRDTIPRHVEATLLKSLAKLPADRFADAAKFAEALANPAATAGFAEAAASAGRATGGESVNGAAVKRWRIAAAAGWLVGVAALVAVAWLARDRARGATDTLPVVRGLVPTGDKVAAQGTGLAVSPDGSKILYLATDSSPVPRLVLHDLATNTQQVIPSSDFGSNPFFSPDGREIGFTSGGRIIRLMSLAGGGQRDFYTAAGPRHGAVWGRDSVITLASRAILRLPLATSRPDTLVAVTGDPDELYISPSLSPDGSTVFFVRSTPGVGSGPMLSVSVASKRVTPLNIEGARPVLVGRTLTYGTRDGSLWAIDFDLARLRTLGAPRAIAQSVSPEGAAGIRAAVSPQSGTVAYLKGDGSSVEREIAVLDRAGRAKVVSTSNRPYRFPRFSPDGLKIAVGVGSQTGANVGDIWLLNVANGVLQRLTSDTMNLHPNWEADGRGLLFIKRRFRAPQAVFRVPADGSAPPAFVTEHGNQIWEAVPTPDGKQVVFREDVPGANRDIYVVSRDSGAKAVPLAATRFDEKGIALSPDGKWLAYASDETGTNEVYIRKLDASARQWPVSRNGGTEPRWTKSGEIFFRRGDSVFVSRVTLGAEPAASPPAGLFAARFDATGFEPMWDASPDGKQFVVTRSIRQGEQKLMVLVNALCPRP